MKKYVILILCFLLSLLVVLSACSSDRMIETSADELWEYTLLHDDTVKITKYLGDKSTVSVPESISSFTVSTIGAQAFAGTESLVEVLIPKTISSIEEGAFNDCINLSHILLSCHKLQPCSRNGTFLRAGTNTENGMSVTVREEVTCIPDYFFYSGKDADRAKIDGIVFGTESNDDSIDEIGAYAFGNCNIKSITFLGNPPLKIDDTAFYNTNVSINYSAYSDIWDSFIKKTYGGNVSYFSFFIDGKS